MKAGTLADGLAVPVVGAIAFDVARRFVDSTCAVSEVRLVGLLHPGDTRAGGRAGGVQQAALHAIERAPAPTCGVGRGCAVDAGDDLARGPALP